MLTRRHWDLSCWQDLGPVGDESMIAYAWPGGYPVVYIDPDDDTEGLCVETVREIIAADEWPDDRSVDSYTHYEGSPVECRCGKLIESAYGEVF